jgi:hypothetical protein
VEIEKAINSGPTTLDNVRAVLVNVDGESKIAHYRHGFTDNGYGHLFSVTKSVLSILIGIAVADALTADIGQPLAELLPKHRRALRSSHSASHQRHSNPRSAAQLTTASCGGSSRTPTRLDPRG